MWHYQGVLRDEQEPKGRSERPRKERRREHQPRERRVLPPLDPARLNEMALRYVSRFATTRAKLAEYLRRKLRERGWIEEGVTPDLAPLVEKLADLGYVDDAAFARAKGGSLRARGLGRGRLTQALRIAGVSEDDGAEATAAANDGAAAAALHFARRRRIGPYAAQRPDRAGREKWIAAMLRGGHPLALAKRLVDAAPGEEWSVERLEDSDR